MTIEEQFNPRNYVGIYPKAISDICIKLHKHNIPELYLTGVMFTKSYYSCLAELYVLTFIDIRHYHFGSLQGCKVYKNKNQQENKGEFTKHLLVFTSTKTDIVSRLKEIQEFFYGVSARAETGGIIKPC